MTGFVGKFMQNYALCWVKNHIDFLPQMINENQPYIDDLIEKKILLWPNLTDDIRMSLLDKAKNFSSIILRIDEDEMCDVILDKLYENHLTIDRQWLKDNLVSYREELRKLTNTKTD